MNTTSIKLSKNAVVWLTAAAMVAAYLAPFAVLDVGAQAMVCGDLLATTSTSVLSFGTGVDSANNVYAADFINKQVKKFDSNGNLLATIGAGSFTNNPFAVHYDNTANELYVDDTGPGGGNVRVFSSSGTLLRSFPAGAVRGIDVDETANEVYLGEGTNVKVHTPTGTLIRQFAAASSLVALALDGSGGVWTRGVTVGEPVKHFSATGSLLGQFSPGGQGQGIASRFGKVVVGQSGANTVNVYDPDGTLLASFPAGGDPRGPSIDSQGNIWVGDATNSVVKKFYCGDLLNAPLVCGDLITSWGSQGSGAGQFDSGPRGVAVGAGGNVYVADGLNDRVEVFNSSGGFLFQFGTPGGGDGQFSSGGGSPAHGLGTNAAGQVYVAQPAVAGTQARVQRFSSSGVFELKFGTGGTGNGEFNAAQSVDTDSFGNVYVADTGNARIQKFDANGNFILQWPVLGGVPQSQPRGVAVGPNDNVYVTDEVAHNVKKYSNTGALLATIGTVGSGDGQFSSPRGIDVDDAGLIYVADGQNHRVQVLNSDGTFLAKMGTVGSAPGQFSNLVDVEVDNATGAIYATDLGNERVSKFAGCEAPPPPLSQCAITALQSMGLNPGDFPNLESALDDACMEAPDNVTTIAAGSEPATNYKMAPGEVVVLGAGATINNNLIGDNGSQNQLFLGNNVTISNNTLKTEEIWVGGTGNLIEGNVNHEVDINVGPNAELTVNGNINDLQNLNIGSNGTLNVGGNVDIWVSVDIASGGLLSVGGSLDCNGSPSVINNGTVTATTNNCPLITTASAGGGFNLALYLPLLALAALGLAIYVRPKR